MSSKKVDNIVTMLWMCCDETALAARHGDTAIQNYSL